MACSWLVGRASTPASILRRECTNEFGQSYIRVLRRKGRVTGMSQLSESQLQCKDLHVGIITVSPDVPSLSTIAP